ncbi:hypothetical protein Tco_0509223 [Tanacetum coccineum]
MFGLMVCGIRFGPVELVVVELASDKVWSGVEKCVGRGNIRYDGPKWKIGLIKGDISGNDDFVGGKVKWTMMIWQQAMACVGDGYPLFQLASPNDEYNRRSGPQLCGLYMPVGLETLWTHFWSMQFKVSEIIPTYNSAGVFTNDIGAAYVTMKTNNLQELSFFLSLCAIEVNMALGCSNRLDMDARIMSEKVDLIKTNLNSILLETFVRSIEAENGPRSSHCSGVLRTGGKVCQEKENVEAICHFYNTIGK